MSSDDYLILLGWSRASGFIEVHDHAVAENKSLATIGELRDDLNALKGFTQEQKAKRVIATKTYEHLKG